MKYTEEHEWLKPEKDIVIVGITEHAAEQLGDLVFVELPNKDLEVKKDQEIVVIESVKAASDILAPLDGVITEINDKIVDDPSIVNSDPLGEGWFFKMKLNNPSELDKLLDKDATTMSELATFLGVNISTNANNIIDEYKSFTTV